LLLLAPGSMPARPALLPPLQGELTGRLALRGFAGAPGLDWRLQAQPLADGRTRAQVRVTAPGLSAELELTVSADAKTVAWQLKQGQLDLSVWWRPLAARAGLGGGLPEDLAIAGAVNLRGAGQWSDAGVAGTIEIDAAGTGLGSTAQNWSVPACTLGARVELTPAGLVWRALRLRAPKATVAGLALTDMAVEATGDAPQRMKVTRAGVAVLGGTVTLHPVALDWAHPPLDAMVELHDLALHELAAFVPEALSGAQGRMNGQVELQWSAAEGLRPRGGRLVMAPDAPARLRLAASPGFLTRHVPARIVWLPGWLGGLARRWALDNPAYDTLRRIELGRLPLVVETLQAELYPDGPGGARSAAVQVAARPADDRVVERVTFAVNVSGPLNAVLRLGTDKRVHLQLGLKP
jgi:hypothetical protein